MERESAGDDVVVEGSEISESLKSPARVRIGSWISTRSLAGRSKNDGHRWEGLPFCQHCSYSLCLCSRDHFRNAFSLPSHSFPVPR